MSCVSDACSTCDCKAYTSQVETAILNSCDPISVVESEQINVNGEIGIWVNKGETENFIGPIPVNQYPINKDPVPQVIHKKPRCVECHRDVTIKYLEPPPIPTPGPIVINQAQNILAPAAPPVIIRQVPCKPIEPEPLVVREIPPSPPQPPSEKVITIPGELLPPPPRKVVIERLPELPDKPQDIYIERWLPFKDIKRQIILNPKPSDPVQCKPRNIIINWEKRNCCHINTDIINLGVEKTDPLVYLQTHGASLQHESQMPEICEEVKREHGIPLAVDQCENSFYKELEGDIHALKLIDLDAEGLSEYKKYLSLNCNHCNHCSKCNPAHVEPSPHHLTHTTSSPALLQRQSPCCQPVKLSSSSPPPVLSQHVEQTVSEHETIQVTVTLGDTAQSSVPVPETSQSEVVLSASVAAVGEPEEKRLSPESAVSQLLTESPKDVESSAVQDEPIEQVSTVSVISEPVNKSVLVVEQVQPQEIAVSETAQVEDSAFDEPSIADATSMATEFTQQSYSVNELSRQPETVPEEPAHLVESPVSSDSKPALESLPQVEEPKLVEASAPAAPESSPVTHSPEVSQPTTTPFTPEELQPIESSESPAQTTLTEVTPEFQQETSSKEMSNHSQVEELGNYSLVVETPAATFEHSILVESSQLEQTTFTEHGANNHTFGALEENTHNEDISIIEESVHESLFEEGSFVDDHEPVTNELTKSILQDDLSVSVVTEPNVSTASEHVVNIE